MAATAAMTAAVEGTGVLSARWPAWSGRNASVSEAKASTGIVASERPEPMAVTQRPSAVGNKEEKGGAEER
jgi:hypothetical protein